MPDKFGISFPGCPPWTLPILAAIQDRGEYPTGWTHSKNDSGSNDEGTRVSVRLTHDATGTTVVGNEYGTRKVEFAPARMLRPTNVHLPLDDEELEAAWSKAQRIVGEVADLSGCRGHLSRLDLTCYVPVQTDLIIQLFDRLSAPGFRKATYPARYEGGLHWKGSNKNLLFYSKALEQGEPDTDDRTRIELQLHGNTIARVLGYDAGGKVYEVGVKQCYQSLRRYLLTFPAASVAPEYSQDALVAHASSMGVRAPDGRSLLEWRLDDIKNPKHRRKTRKHIEGMLLKCADFNWADYLPEDPTPEQWKELCGYRN